MRFEILPHLFGTFEKWAPGGNEATGPRDQDPFGTESHLKISQVRIQVGLPEPVLYSRETNQT